jgi:hypothetical protein
MSLVSAQLEALLWEAGSSSDKEATQAIAMKVPLSALRFEAHPFVFKSTRDLTKALREKAVLLAHTKQQRQ